MEDFFASIVAGGVVKGAEFESVELEGVEASDFEPLVGEVADELKGAFVGEEAIGLLLENFGVGELTGVGEEFVIGR